MGEWIKKYAKKLFCHRFCYAGLGLIYMAGVFGVEKLIVYIGAAVVYTVLAFRG